MMTMFGGAEDCGAAETGAITPAANSQISRCFSMGPGGTLQDWPVIIKCFRVFGGVLNFGRDIALRCPRPRSAGGTDGAIAQPSACHAHKTPPIAPQPGADGAARHPYQIRTPPAF